MSCPGCNSSSTQYTRCPQVVSTNCVFYQGNAKTCPSDDGFSICKGDNLSEVQSNIFDRICQLIGDTSVTEVVIPSCLEDAWDDNDLTILNLFNFVLTQQCVLQESIDTINNNQENLNPFVNIIPVCSCNCTDCRVTVRLTDALNDIIICLCNAKAEIATLQSQVNILTTDLAAVQTVYNSFSNFITTTSCTLVNLQCRMVAAEERMDENGLNACVDCTPCIPCP